MRPLAEIIDWKTSPNASRDATPSLKRAPPLCQIPMIGTCAPIAALYAETITFEPSTPSAPLLIVASDAKMTTLLPLTVAVTAIIPHSVRGIRKLKTP